MGAPQSAAARNPGYLVLGGTVAMAVGIFLPWIKVSAPFVGTVTKAGIDGDGKFLLAIVLGLGVCLYFYVTGGRGGLATIMVLLTLAAAGLMVLDGIDAAKRFSDMGNSLSGASANNPLASALSSTVSYGFDSGFYLTSAGAIVAVIGSLLALRPQREIVQSPPADTPTPAV